MDKLEIQCNGDHSQTSDCVPDSKITHNNHEQTNHHPREHIENGCDHNLDDDLLLLSECKAQKMTVKMVNDYSVNSSDSVQVKNALAEKEEQLTKAKATIERMQKQLTELENNGAKVDKMKMLAVKLKKDLAFSKEELIKVQQSEKETKEQLRSTSKELERISILYQQSVKNFQTLQAEYDKLQDEFDQGKQSAKSVNNEFTTTVNELSKLKEEYSTKIIENDVLNSKIMSLKEMIADFEKKIQDLESNLIIARSELEKERRQKTDGQELEKNIQELKKELEAKNSQLADLEKQNEINRDICNKYDALKPLHDELLAVKTRIEKENTTLVDNINQLNEQVATLTKELSEERATSEKLVSEKNKLLGKCKHQEEQYLRKSKLLADKICQLEESAALADEELRRKDQEFNNYKTRVTSLLQKNQQNSEQEDEIKNLQSALDKIMEERNALFKELKLLKEEKSTLLHSLENMNHENKQLTDELKQISTLNEANCRLKKSLQLFEAEIISKAKEFDLQIKQTEEAFQIKEKSFEEKVNSLKSKILSLEEEIDSLKRQSNSPVSCKTNHKESLPTTSSTPNDLNPDCSEVLDHSECNYRTDYESGDNLSHTDTARRTPLSSFSSSKSPAVHNPLYEILNSKEVDPEEEVIQYVKQVGDLTQLLKETESNNALLTEQNRVLKEEIRRLQRSMERTESAKNLEYLKNVLVKFVETDVERSQLVPVLTTLLKLSKSEEKIFADFASTQLASQTSANSTPVNQANNWSSYLWPSFTQ